MLGLLTLQILLPQLLLELPIRLVQNRRPIQSLQLIRYVWMVNLDVIVRVAYSDEYDYGFQKVVSNWFMKICRKKKKINGKRSSIAFHWELFTLVDFPFQKLTAARSTLYHFILCSKFSYAIVLTGTATFYYTVFLLLCFLIKVLSLLIYQYNLILCFFLISVLLFLMVYL